MTIHLHGAGLRHGQVRALEAVDLRIDKGERVAIIGPSGAGKSSLLHLIATAVRPSAGRLELLDEQPWALSSRARQRLRARVGLVHQAPPLPPRQRVVTAVLAGRLGQWGTLRGLLNLIYPSDVPGARQALAELGLADKLFVQCGQLSGGQLQRVGIARALYQRPDVLLADEPVSAMDPVLAEHSLALLNRHAREHGVTLVASLHAVELALAHFPRVVGIRDGQVVFDCPAEAVTESLLDALYANEQLSSPPVPGPTLTVQIPRC
ncbi:phosphonate ABC transporter ATP-binding protein [Pseudomonas guariconensis]|uniref:phosphonate ABC transporter ATP-binding protein n=1 Tax=Pseudomonas TaxID=286 RepID=UPI001CE49AB6|nr:MULTISPECIES: phosphonate ABC transporter ATP-binding protein [Pseudomonas]MCO7637329.1 phosphonate ABC transporter ATP-binding protein [Pseudomonas sp. S 311-6]MCO7515668.1 phosphonate ABC transporter ATP-binding protein [Pseudomonas putida]MCO7566170.1 phosphonate ABC transporter ATP-binding protein [Pseudomonas mosselii]MCO7606385.1 phosphonate ABC transporter ATP-binding protein [Pseudomonas guariconensis]MCO7617262.1 phosphonate ABC transporter ATP-binding protein [Pseudomonas guaricon